MQRPVCCSVIPRVPGFSHSRKAAPHVSDPGNATCHQQGQGAAGHQQRMNVHVPETGNQKLVPPVDESGTGRDLNAAAPSDVAYAVSINDDGVIFEAYAGFDTYYRNVVDRDRGFLRGALRSRVDACSRQNGPNQRCE